jgi:hypothetical protein
MSHGSSPAAWTAVLVCLVGFTIGAIGLIPDPNWVLFTIGCVLAAGAGLVGLVMAAAGMGADRSSADH